MSPGCNKSVYFLSTLIIKNLVRSLAAHRSTEVSTSNVQDLLVKFVSKEAQNSNMIAAILNSTQQQGRDFVTSFRPRDFVQMASEEPFNYHSGLWLLLSLIIFSQTWSKLRSDSIEDGEVDNHFSPSRHFLVGRTDVTLTRPGCLDSFKMAASEVYLLRRISSG